MRNMEIIRITSSMVHGTRGVMVIDRQPLGVTLELPWRMNVSFKSCIPIGDYICARFTSGRYGETFIVMGVYDREGILFYPGNFLVDTDGSIIPGLSFCKANEEELVQYSKRAFDRMMKRLSGSDTFRLTIRNAF